MMTNLATSVNAAMAEVNEISRRREIRRRKILDNSEARLNKIVGSDKKQYSDTTCLNPTVEVQEGCSFQDDSNAQDTPSNFSIQNVSNNFQGTSKNQITQRDCGKSQQKTKTLDENKQQFGSQANVSHSRNANFVVSSSGDKEPPLVNGPNVSDVYAFPKKVSDAETRSYGRTRADNRRNSSCTQLMIETLQLSSLSRTALRPWLVTAIAFLAKICLLFDDKFPVAQSLFLPYLLLELVIYGWIKPDTQASSRPISQSLINGILLLCGIPSSYISKFNGIWSALYNLGQDFAVYLFSFVAFHLLCENCV